jgi:hypothetical protein
MGQGRNSVYLASLGWQVWGFDPAEAGVAIAQKQAKELGLTLHASAVRDSEFDFGKERFDLVLFSWDNAARAHPEGSRFTQTRRNCRHSMRNAI